MENGVLECLILSKLSIAFYISVIMFIVYRGKLKWPSGDHYDGEFLHGHFHG